MGWVVKHLTVDERSREQQQQQKSRSGSQHKMLSATEACLETGRHQPSPSPREDLGYTSDSHCSPGPLQLLVQIPGSLSADTAHGCLGGNSGSQGEVETVKGTSMTLLLTDQGTLMGSATHFWAALPHTTPSHPLLLCWKQLSQFSTKSIFCRGFWLPQNETNKYKGNHTPPILTVLQKLRKGNASVTLYVLCSAFTLVETIQELLDCSLPLQSLTNQVSFFKLIKCIIPPAKLLSLFPGICFGCTIVLALQLLKCFSFPF